MQKQTSRLRSIPNIRAVLKLCRVSWIEQGLWDQQLGILRANEACRRVKIQQRHLNHMSSTKQLRWSNLSEYLGT